MIVVDYKAGNLASVRTALLHLGAEPEVTGDPDVVGNADRVLFPGVGAAGAAMAVLRERGLDDAMRRAVARGVPILGICIGTQVALDHSEEDGGTACLGLLPGDVRRFDPAKVEGGKVPHMGWNSVEFEREHPVLEGVASGAEFYFVHSYYPVAGVERIVLGTTEYGRRFHSALARDNIVATQFHPEKSGRHGLKLLENFLAWRP